MSKIALLKRIRDRRLSAEAGFVASAESAGVLQHFADGAAVDVARIKPEVSICFSREQFELFRYCRLKQAFPTTGLVGRQIRAIIWDVGQDRPFVMGAIGLSSSPYSLRDRDRFLGWDSPNSVKTKERGLRCIMQLSVCMAVPPYHFLGSGKLIAALALSQPITSFFKAHYHTNLPKGGRLLALVATCAGGIHCPIFNRIMLREGGLYRRIGQTAGYSTAMFSERTRQMALRLVRSTHNKNASLEFANSLQVLTNALRQCSIPSDCLMRLGYPKGVYLGYFDKAAPRMLRTGNYRVEAEQFSVKLAAEQWASRVLLNRISNEMTVSLLRQYRQRPLMFQQAS